MQKSEWKLEFDKRLQKVLFADGNYYPNYTWKKIRANFDDYTYKNRQQLLSALFSDFWKKSKAKSRKEDMDTYFEKYKLNVAYYNTSYHLIRHANKYLTAEQLRYGIEHKVGVENFSNHDLIYTLINCFPDDRMSDFENSDPEAISKLRELKKKPHLLQLSQKNTFILALFTLRHIEELDVNLWVFKKRTGKKRK